MEIIQQFVVQWRQDNLKAAMGYVIKESGKADGSVSVA
jgi:hypothetical protein